MVSLKEILQFREQKAAEQLKMMAANPNAVLISLGMNIPGPVKNSSIIEEAFGEGMKEVERLLQEERTEIIQKRILIEQAGCAALYLVKEMDCLRAKQAAVLLEKTHILGRIWDIDIIEKDGMAISRKSVGEGERKCFICGGNAKICGRSRRHTIQELQDWITNILREWKTG